MHCGYHVKEDSVSLAIVRFEIKDLVPHQVRSIIKFFNCSEIHLHLGIGLYLPIKKLNISHFFLARHNKLLMPLFTLTVE